MENKLYNMQIIKFNEYLNENIDTIVKDKLTGKYISLQRGIIQTIGSALSDDVDEIRSIVKNIQKSGIDNVKVNGLIENNDLYNFYLKFQNDIDTLLKDDGFFNIAPQTNSIFSLYDYIIEGTKKSIDIIIQSFSDDIFKTN